MTGSASEFVRPETKSAPRGPYRPWTDAEDAILLDAIRAGRTYDEIVVMLHGRRRSALINRIHRLREEGNDGVVARGRGRPHIYSRTADPILESTPVKPALYGSLNLLRAMLRYGARHDGLPGLPAAQFISLCHQHGVAIQ
nr:hypothetical protein [Sphingomonas laterariae]